ncbi:MAG: hypothetical protein GY797_02250 [Deltaproteobacteria bacterium]|nr:hypothetical protein [Deltaproteobacteria bacterium]
MSTIYERCWSKEKCIRVLGRRACASATACIRIFDEDGVYKIELQIGNNKIKYDLLDTCYPAYEVGIARLNVCIREVRISGGRLRSIMLTAELCIGVRLLGRKVEKCWELIDQTVSFGFVPLQNLYAEIDDTFKFDDKLKELLDLAKDKDDEVAIVLDDAEPDDDGIVRPLALWGARVLNNHPNKVQCWTGEPTTSTNKKNFFYVEGDGGISPDDVDVDHVEDPSGQWWKCGEDVLSRRTVVIERNGAVQQAECKTTGPGKPCSE